MNERRTQPQAGGGAGEEGVPPAGARGGPRRVAAGCARGPLGVPAPPRALTATSVAGAALVFSVSALAPAQCRTQSGGSGKTRGIECTSSRPAFIGRPPGWVSRRCLPWGRCRRMSLGMQVAVPRCVQTDCSQTAPVSTGSHAGARRNPERSGGQPAPPTFLKRLAKGRARPTPHGWQPGSSLLPLRASGARQCLRDGNAGTAAASDAMGSRPGDPVPGPRQEAEEDKAVIAVVLSKCRYGEHMHTPVHTHAHTTRTHMHTHAHTTRTHVRTHVHTICTHAHVHTHDMHTHPHVHTCMHTCAHTHTHAHTACTHTQHKRVHAHTHTHVHTHVHARHTRTHAHP